MIVIPDVNQLVYNSFNIRNSNFVVTVLQKFGAVFKGIFSNIPITTFRGLYKVLELGAHIGLAGCVAGPMDAASRRFFDGWGLVPALRGRSVTEGLRPEDLYGRQGLQLDLAL